MLNGKRPAANAKCCVLFAFLLTVLTPVLCYGEAAILKLNYRNASEVLPLVENLLSREGRAAVDTQANSLVIVDTPESIRRVEAFLANLDQPLKQTRIRVKFVEAESQQGGSFSVEGSISGQNWRISKGRPRDGVDIRARTKTSEHRERSEFYIQVASGNWAYMAIGKEIPFSRRWVDLSAILETGSSESRSSLSILLMVEAVQ